HRGDSLFVWYQSQYPYRYYAECQSCDVLSRQVVSDAVWPKRPSEAPGAPALVTHPPELYVGAVSHDPDAYLVPFDALRGKKRVWLLFSSTWDDAFVRLVLDCTGRELDEVRATRAVLYLYDL